MAKETELSDHEKTIISEFSTFYSPIERGGYTTPTWSNRDRRLENVLQALVQNAPPVGIATWARYFLVFSWQQNPQLLSWLGLVPGSSLSQIFDQLTQVAPVPNRELSQLHRHLEARCSDRQVQQFLNTDTNLANKFLVAHLQKPCWFAARWFYNSRLVMSRLGERYSLNDCFQIANEASTNPAKLLQNFQLAQRDISIKTYAEKVLRGIIRSTINQHVETQHPISPWGVLRYVAKRELVEALQAAGYQDSDIKSYGLLWHSFKEIYQTKQTNLKQLPEPTEQQIQQICDRYNQRRKDFQLESPMQSHLVLSGLQRCAQVIQNYRSLDSVYGRLLDEANNPEASDPLEQLIQYQRAMQAECLKTLAKSVIATLFPELPEVTQVILKLYLGLEFNQTEILGLIGQQFNLQKQYQVCRKKDGYKRIVLRRFIQELNQQYSDLLPEILTEKTTPDETLQQLQQFLDIHLEQFCKASFAEILYQTLNNLLSHYNGQFSDPIDLVTVFHWLYHDQFGQRPPTVYQSPPAPIDFSSAEIIDHLKMTLKSAIADSLTVDFNQCASTEHRFQSFLEWWLQNHVEQNNPSQAGE